ncbi:hypothetical protein BUY94_01095 [Mammaliicoccus fleurettii]|nr:hypothetical protein BUY94_01095 [Mammaliicoccus fleurettii]RIL52739.1 hypothetical protein BUY93_01885 [Mammaliicoccus fleurettii]
MILFVQVFLFFLYNLTILFVHVYLPFIQSYDFVRACLPRGMVRACSLSRILFPQASALTKSS